MRVLINGLPLFAARLAKDLQEFDPGSRYVFLDTYNSAWAKMRFLLLLPFADMVLSYNGVTEKSGTLEWALRLRKRLVLNWAGTDALIASQRRKDGTIYRKYIDYGYNIVDSPWLEREVGSLGVKTYFGLSKYPKPAGQPVDRYERISVVTYIAQARQEFYGMPLLVAAAKTFPQVVFTVFGTAEPDIPCPENIRCVGWRPEEELAEAIRNTPVLLRLTHHDGFSVTVVEALGAGCEVLWTMPFPPTIHVTNETELIDRLRETFDRITARGLRPNEENIRWAVEHCDREKVIRSYIRILHGFGRS